MKLQYTKTESLQAVVELETSNEELQAAMSCCPSNEEAPKAPTRTPVGKWGTD